MAISIFLYNNSQHLWFTARSHNSYHSHLQAYQLTRKPFFDSVCLWKCTFWKCLLKTFSLRMKRFIWNTVILVEIPCAYDCLMCIYVLIRNKCACNVVQWNCLQLQIRQTESITVKISSWISKMFRLTWKNCRVFRKNYRNYSDKRESFEKNSLISIPKHADVVIIGEFSVE